MSQLYQTVLIEKGIQKDGDNEREKSIITYAIQHIIE